MGAAEQGRAAFGRIPIWYKDSRNFEDYVFVPVANMVPVTLNVVDVMFITPGEYLLYKLGNTVEALEPVFVTMDDLSYSLHGTDNYTRTTKYTLKAVATSGKATISAIKLARIKRLAAAGIIATRKTSRLKRSLGPKKYGIYSRAHHVFPVELFDTDIGKKLHKWGIDLNSVDNGIWLPVKTLPGVKATVHRGKNTKDYLRHIQKQLQRAGNKDEALEILDDIKDELRNGTLKINSSL